MLSEAVGKLKEGLDKNNGKKFIKYSVAFDGLLPCSLGVFNSQKYTSKDMALPKVVTQHVKNQALDLDTLTLVKDSKVQLYTGRPIQSKKGTIYYKEELVDTHFRLIITKSKTDNKQQYWFITNNFELSAKEITQAYRRRWDIEVFFCFIKQELNVSHLVSLNKNGIQVIIYMTLIVAMLILIYKKANKIGYKTAKIRFRMEVRNLCIAMIITKSGGDPNIFFKT